MEDFIVRIAILLIIQTGGKMPKQSMIKRKRDQVQVNSNLNEPDEYENGKLRDKKQKKLEDYS